MSLAWFAHYPQVAWFVIMLCGNPRFALHTILCAIRSLLRSISFLAIRCLLRTLSLVAIRCFLQTLSYVTIRGFLNSLSFVAILGLLQTLSFVARQEFLHPLSSVAFQIAIRCLRRPVSSLSTRDFATWWSSIPILWFTVLVEGIQSLWLKHETKDYSRSSYSSNMYVVICMRKMYLKRS